MAKAKVAAEIPALMEAKADSVEYPLNTRNRFIACWKVRDALSTEPEKHCRNLSWYSGWNPPDTTTLQMHCRAQSAADCPLLQQ